MDSIELKALKFFARHGAIPQERLAGNDFEVDLRVDFDASGAMESDNLAATVNYAALVAIVEEEMARPSALLEHLAGRIRSGIMRRFPMVRAGAVTVRKMAPPLSRQMDFASFTTRWP